MGVNVSNLDEYSDADILKVLNKALVDTAFARSYSINGRSLDRHPLSEIHRLKKEYERRVAASKGKGSRVARARFRVVR